MEFPYGNAPLAILILAVGAAAAIFIGQTQNRQQPDLVFQTFSKEHYASHLAPIAAFEKLHHCTIDMELVDMRALENRLEAAMQANAVLPDMVNLQGDDIGYFTKGPLKDIGFIDLTAKLHSSGLYDQLVQSRLKKWSSRGHVYALPMDVHPVMLAYRSDLIAQLGIDVNGLKTWDDFARVGRQVVRESTDSQGRVRHYMIDLTSDGSDLLRILILQHGGGLFDDNDNVTFDSEKALDVVYWYVHQIANPDSGAPTQTAFPAGWGQPLTQAMMDGTDLFYLCPDWRTEQFEQDAPMLSGKMSLIPLPVWAPGERDTTTWGGTGMAFTRSCIPHFELAWDLACYLYYSPQQLEKNFKNTHILPPLKSAWDLPAFHVPDPYFGGIPLGATYAKLAPEVPAEEVNAYTVMCQQMLTTAMSTIAEYYKAHGDQGLRAFARAELHRRADRMRAIIARNLFLKEPVLASPPENRP